MENTDQIVERVNLVYKALGDNEGREVELPFRLLVLSDFSADDASSVLESQVPIGLSRYNIDQVLAGFHIRLSLQLNNHLLDQGEGDLNIELPIKNMSDFSPDSIIENVPELKELCRLRTLFTTLHESGGKPESLIQTSIPIIEIKGPARSYLKRAGILVDRNESGKSEQKVDIDLLEHLFGIIFNNTVRF